jgi:hypothetical protein
MRGTCRARFYDEYGSGARDESSSAAGFRCSLAEGDIMKYLLATGLGIGDDVWEIVEERFSKILRSQKAVLQILAIEEQFDMLLENFYEFEAAILMASLRHQVYNRFNYQSAHDDRILISRRLENMLSTCRSYLDSTHHYLSQVYGDDSDIEYSLLFKKSLEYDHHLGYRVTEALRNYVQHVGRPVHAVVYSSRLIEPSQNALSSITVAPTLSVAELEKDDKFKASVLDELRELDDNIDLRPLIREYVDCLYEIQGALRRNCLTDLQEWESEIGNAVEMASGEDQPDPPGVIAIYCEDQGEVVGDRVRIIPQSVDRAYYFMNKNKVIRPISSRFVSSQVDQS